ncbi:hypothetical protein C7I36_06315 [Zobellella taiwanensis]|uniref:Uncharacterized protein n=1 Tax=Zobellella taiwanensis TaxID=347535 RepID=A0A2P7R4F5_9GAMM|nr:hypothetical protein [Zobellella taiwanensis]PSJ45071.1 hypothetical protein C7I36_06315 [Zobellella taiwanensis]
MEDSKKHPDFYGYNDGLEEWEIEERESRLKEIREGVNQFLNNTKLNLTIKNLEIILTPGIPSCVIYGSTDRPTFGIGWISNSVIPKIKKYIISAAIEKALETVENEKVSAYVLRGSATAASKKLIMQNVLGLRQDINKRYNWDDYEQYNLNIPSINLMSYEFINAVTNAYEEKYMRYRFWDEESLNALADFLLFDHSRERNDIELPAMAEDMEGEKLSQNEFIDLASDTILSYAEPDGTEISYPFFSEKSYIFSEFTPLHLAEEEIQTKLYEWYLEAYKSHK